MKARSLLLVLGLVLAALASPASAAAYVYWTDNTVQSPGVELIGRANLDGSGAEHELIKAAGPESVAVDGSHIYWSEVSGWIGRAKLDGSDAEPEFIEASSAFYFPRRVAVDGGHVYWTTLFGSTIGRAKLDGSEVDSSFVTGIAHPCGLAVDGGGPGAAGGSGNPPPPPPPASPPAPASPVPVTHLPPLKLKLNAKTGSATVTATVPGPGKLVLSGAAIVTQSKRAKGAGAVTLKVKPTAKTIKALDLSGRAAVRAKLVFTPPGGKPLTHSLSLTLKKGSG